MELRLSSTRTSDCCWFWVDEADDDVVVVGCLRLSRFGGRTTWKALPPRLQRPLRHVRSCFSTCCWMHRFSASESVDGMHLRWRFWRHRLLHLIAREKIKCWGLYCYLDQLLSSSFFLVFFFIIIYRLYSVCGHDGI